MKTIENRKSKTGNAFGFTLIELLVVIAIIGVLAAMTIPILGSLKRQQALKVARGEMEKIETALESYKAQYGVYPPGNQNAADLSKIPPYYPALYNQLYYELSGTTNNGGAYVTLDGVDSISISPANQVKAAYGVEGFVNNAKGGGEDVQPAQNFLPGLKPNAYNSSITNNSIRTTELVTSFTGTDPAYQPLGPGSAGINPFRYLYPGVNNPNSYDLWVQLVIKGKTNLVCNWNKQVIINSSLP